MKDKQANILDSLFPGASQPPLPEFLFNHQSPTPSLIKDRYPRAIQERNNEWSLLLRIKQGHEEAFMLLIDKYHSSLLGFARTFDSDENRAQELAQEAWEVFLNRVHHFDQSTSVKIRIFKILIDRFHRQEVQPSLNLPTSEHYQTPLSETSSNSHHRIWNLNLNLSSQEKKSPSDDPQNPFSQTKGLSEKIFEDLRTALYRLPPKQRQVVYLRDVEGFDSDAVLHLLQISKPRQHLLLQKARETMRNVLHAAMEIQANLLSQNFYPFNGKEAISHNAIPQWRQPDANSSGKTK